MAAGGGALFFELRLSREDLRDTLRYGAMRFDAIAMLLQSLCAGRWTGKMSPPSFLLPLPPKSLDGTGAPHTEA